MFTWRKRIQNLQYAVLLEVQSLSSIFLSVLLSWNLQYYSFKKKQLDIC